MKKIFLLFAMFAMFLSSFAQERTNYQFCYYKAGTDAEPIYYFSDLFSLRDWDINIYEIKRAFKRLLYDEGRTESIREDDIKQGILYDVTDSKAQANEFKDTIIKIDKDNFERKQTQYPKDKRETFRSSKKTLPLYRLHE